MTFRQFLSILFARRKLFASVLLLVVLMTLVVSLLLPKKYTAVASVVLDVKPDPVSAIAFQSAISPALIATQIDIIQSDRVARKVVRSLKLAEVPQIRQQWAEEKRPDGDIETWLIELFQKDLEVKPARESSVISVTYRARDPRFAAALANAFVQAYVETTLELRTDPAKQYSAFFDGRVKEAREALEKAQARLSAYQSEKGIIANDERLDVENQRLNELSSQLVALQALAAESGSRQTQAQGQSGERLQEVLNNPLIAGLKADVARAEARLQELSAKLGDSHPQVLETRANINELRKRIDQETGRVTGGVTVSNTINKQRESDVRASLEAQRAKVLRLKAVRDEGSVIVREVENAQRAYDAVLARFTQTNLESQATSSNVNVLTPAVAPLEHSSPKLLLNVILSVFLGAFLAAGIVLGAELRDRRIRDSDDIGALLGLPLLGLLPGSDDQPAKRKSKDLSREQRLIGGNHAQVKKAA